MLLFPLVLLAIIPLTGILLGSLGMDIHWSCTRGSRYALAFVVALLLYAWITIGIKLRRTGKSSQAG